MVEWIAFLQKVTSKLFPQNPPKPLFKSADKIEETVEEMIKQQSFSRSTSSELNAQGSKGKESIQANGEQKNAQVAESDKPGPARDLSATTMTEAPHVAAVEVIIPVQSPESRS